jgi:hypothetical protein
LWKSSRSIGNVLHQFLQQGGGPDDVRRLLLEKVEEQEFPGDQSEHEPPA